MLGGGDWRCHLLCVVRLSLGLLGLSTLIASEDFHVHGNKGMLCCACWKELLRRCDGYLEPNAYALLQSARVTVEGISCLTCSGTSPLMRRRCLSCTSAVYSYPCIYTARSLTQYNLSSILQFFCICAFSTPRQILTRLLSKSPYVRDQIDFVHSWRHPLEP